MQLDEEKKYELFDLVVNKKRTVKDAAGIMGVHYSTAKYIVKALRKKMANKSSSPFEGKINVVPPAKEKKDIPE